MGKKENAIPEELLETQRAQREPAKVHMLITSLVLPFKDLEPVDVYWKLKKKLI